MRPHHRYTRTPQHMTANLTPLVDVIFMLTIFFMLVSRFSSAEQLPMQLPKPDHSRAKVVNLPERIVINCRLASVGAADRSGAIYSIGPNKPEPLSVISERLAALKRRVPKLKVVVRADRRLPYDRVRAVMRVVAQHDIEMLNIVAHVSEDE